MPLDQDTAEMLRTHGAEPNAVRTVIFGRCWANSPWSDDLQIELQVRETPARASTRVGGDWSLQWLYEAGHRMRDRGGVELEWEAPATQAGRAEWTPAVRLPKVDDGVSDDAEKGSPDHRRRLAGEVALASLWRTSARRYAIEDDIRPVSLGGGGRGARFKNAIIAYCNDRLPEGWSVRAELRLDRIRGLHLRADVGERQSDIAVFDPAGNFMAMVSSKWTWRSDRGTEAAQILAMRRYRPDIPYLLATSEFPRAASLVRESVEDRVFHTAPAWVGAWTAVYRAGGSAAELYPSLDDLEREGEQLAGPLGLGISDLALLPQQLSVSGRVG